MEWKTLPEWFAPVFAWLITIVVLATAAAQPEGVYVNRSLLWFLPLMALAWTSGYIGNARLKTKFREEHEALGSPQLFGTTNGIRRLKFLGYLFGFQFLRLRDTAISVSLSLFVVLTVTALVGLFLLHGSAQSTVMLSK